ncbi:MAG: hypothetical protein SGJ02_08990 [bacterium]|nr:hypothetical protein [bacterium]
MKKLFISSVAFFFIYSSAYADIAYEQSQDGTIKTFESIITMIGDGTLTESTAKISIPDKDLHYLTGAYLFCTIKNGACPVILQAILETDIINSQLEKKESCSNMLRFWKHWVDNGFEDRLSYSLGTGFLSKYFDFKSNTRPKFLKCSATVKAQIKPDVSLSDFIKSRYEKSGESFKAINTLLGFTKALKTQGKDTFVATGAYKQKKENGRATK